MSNIAKTRVPHEGVYGLYPALESTGIVAAGAGDDVEVVGDWVSTTGENVASLTAHGVEDEQLEALALEIFLRLTLATTETFSLKALKVETAPPDSSGDPDAAALVLVPAVERNVDLVSIGATPKTDLLVGVTAGVQDDILVRTATGGDTVDFKMIVRLSFVVVLPIGLNFFRVKITPDLGAAGTDTADMLGAYGFVPSHVPIYDPKGI